MIRSLFFILFFVTPFFCNAQHVHPIQPNFLKSGDTVAIIAPSGILKNGESMLQTSIALLKNWGLHVLVGENVFQKNNHFAGTDLQRIADFQKALDHPKVKAIWCARGGYGSVRILDYLDFTNFKKNPKWIIGYSDITALHSTFHNLGYQTIHAIMGTTIENDGDLQKMKDNIDSFKNAIFGEKITYKIFPSTYNKNGTATGELVGGNLTLLHTMLGSTTSINTDDKILFIEEIGEYKYHIDRMLQSLKRAGYFNKCKGVIVGGMTKIRTNTTSWGSSVEQLILDALQEYDFPILFDFPAGHGEENRAIILGKKILLKVTNDSAKVVYL